MKRTLIGLAMLGAFAAGAHAHAQPVRIERWQGDPNQDHRSKRRAREERTRKMVPKGRR